MQLIESSTWSKGAGKKIPAVYIRLIYQILMTPEAGAANLTPRIWVVDIPWTARWSSVIRSKAVARASRKYRLICGSDPTPATMAQVLTDFLEAHKLFSREDQTQKGE